MKKYFNKQTFTAFILGAILFTSVGVFAETQNITLNPYPVLINGTVSTVGAYNIDGYTYLKLADMRQTGLKVVFNETDSKIEITSTSAESTITVPTPEPTTPSQTTPSQETAQPTETTPEPEPAPDLTVYNAKLDLLTETYNQDIKEITSDAQEKASQLSQDFYKKYPNAKREDSVNGGHLFKLLDENIDIVNKKAEEQKTLRTKAYDVEVTVLKQQYGID
jgi:hypothetical protein